VVIPCVGSFSLADTAVGAGVAAEDIVAGDISLYSTALGNALAYLNRCGLRVVLITTQF